MIKFFRKIRQRMITENKVSKYLLYAIGEIILVVIGIVIALQLNTWKETENNKISEQKILSEIRNGIWRDLADFEVSVAVNQKAIIIETIFKDYINKKAISQDSIKRFYIHLLSYSSPVINKAGYESLKSSGLKTITNDTLRFQIVELYDYYYTMLENNTSKQAQQLSFSNYSPLISRLYPYIEFNEKGRVISTSSPSLSDLDRKALLSYLEVVRKQRNDIVNKYRKVITEMKGLSSNIDKELSDYIPPEQLQQYTGIYEFETKEKEQISSQKNRITYSINDNYLKGIPNWSINTRSFFMIAPDEFESLSLLAGGSRRMLIKFIRDTNQNIIGVKDINENGSSFYKKIE